MFKLLLLLTVFVGCKSRASQTSTPTELSPEDEAALERMFRRMEDPLALIPGRYDETMTLSEAMLSMPTEERQEIANRLVAGFGLSPDSEQEKWIAFSAKEPKALSLLFVAHTEETLIRSFARANARFQESGATLKEESWLLPSPIDLDTFDLNQLPLPDNTPKQIGSNLWTWTPAADLSGEQIRKRLAMAEVFNRLSDNLAQQGYPSSKLPQSALFKVKYNGKEFVRLDDFINGLHDAGHKITGHVKARAANFLELNSKRADGQLRSVAVVMHSYPPFPIPLNSSAPHMPLPEAHTEMVFEIAPPDGGTARAWDASVDFFLGLGEGVRFGPAGLLHHVAWAGSRTVYHLDQDKVDLAIRAGGFIRHLFRTTAFELNLKDYGYGTLGICSDAVGFIERALDLPVSFEPQFFGESKLSPNGFRFDVSRSASPSDKAFFKNLWKKRKFGAELQGLHSRWKNTYMWRKDTEPFKLDTLVRQVLGCDESVSTDEVPCK